LRSRVRVVVVAAGVEPRLQSCDFRTNRAEFSLNLLALRSKLGRASQEQADLPAGI
jgi:hypothetical protein